VSVLTYWCRTCGGKSGPNFGDALGPRLLFLVGVEAEWAPPDRAKLVTAGSVLSKFKPGWRGTVWGTGFIQAEMTGSLSKARVLSVRGELTREHARLPKKTPLSDPGILAVDLLPEGVLPGVSELLVPHYVDHEMIERHPETPVADICGDPAELLAAIAGASLVRTSSLHAMIAADALGVHHVWEPCERVTGGDFKFNDYLSAFGETIRPNVERLTPRPAMEQKQREARDQLEEIARVFTEG
jgi:hypothetical protein